VQRTRLVASWVHGGTSGASAMQIDKSAAAKQKIQGKDEMKLI
jgi:hypothetical protein